jgi:hypothetical protein
VSWTCDRDPAHKAETLPDDTPAGWQHLEAEPMSDVEGEGHEAFDICGPCWTQVRRLLAGPRAPMFSSDAPPPRFERPHDTVELQ